MRILCPVPPLEQCNFLTLQPTKLSDTIWLIGRHGRQPPFSLHPCHYFPPSACSFTMKMEAADSSETLITAHQTTHKRRKYSSTAVFLRYHFVMRCKQGICFSGRFKYVSSLANTKFKSTIFWAVTPCSPGVLRRF
jgi:hypothetical protein